MKTIYVWITFDDGTHCKCGEMISDDSDPGGRFRSEFRYSQEYLNSPLCYPIDPVVLPLSSSIYSIENNTGIFQAFEDSLPDDWGRRLLIKKAKLPAQNQKPSDLLLALGSNGLGALSYFSNDSWKPKESKAKTTQLKSLLLNARKYEQGDYKDDNEILELFSAGSSPGGARPKTVVEDEKGVSWIAKFPSTKDNFNIIPIEYSTLLLAKKAGIQTPNFYMKNIGKKKVLMVERFDVVNKTGRLHRLSFQTLLQATGYYFMSYKELYEILKKYSRKPEVDIPNLYQQMCFNAFIGNTDDHLKNFSMLGDKSGYWLSPAYDLLPDVNEQGEHSLNFDLDPTFPGYEKLKRMGKMFRIRKPESYLDKIIRVLKNWRKVFSENGVPIKDIDRLSKSIDRRLAKG